MLLGVAPWSLDDQLAGASCWGGPTARVGGGRRFPSLVLRVALCRIRKRQVSFLETEHVYCIPSQNTFPLLLKAIAVTPSKRARLAKESPEKGPLALDQSAQVDQKPNFGGRVVSLSDCGVCGIPRCRAPFHGNVCCYCEAVMHRKKQRRWRSLTVSAKEEIASESRELRFQKATPSERAQAEKLAALALGILQKQL